MKPVTNAWLELTTSGVKEIVSLPVHPRLGHLNGTVFARECFTWMGAALANKT